MHYRSLAGVVCATLASLTAAAAATYERPLVAASGSRSGGTAASRPAPSGAQAAPVQPNTTRAHSSRFPDVCETYIKIVESPGDTTVRGIVRVAVEFGNKQTEPACLEDVESEPNPATFTFSVNGVDRTSAFQQEFGHEHVTMASDTLRLGALGAVTLRATIAGHDTQNTPRTDVDSIVTQLAPDYTVFVSGRGDLYQPRATASDSVAFEISNTGNQSAVQYALTPAVSGSVTYDGGVPASVTLSSGERRSVFARFHAQGPGVSGAVSLVASNGAYSGRDSGWVTLRTSSVQVGPKIAMAKPRAAGLTDEYSFSVQNTGYDSASVTLTPVCSGSGVNSSPCTTSLTSAALAAGEVRAVKVIAQASASVGASGQVQLRAVHTVDSGVRDSAITNVTVVSNAGQAGTVSTVAMVTPFGDRMARTACPTLGAGANSAVQCGDLLYAHTFPAYRSMNKARNVTMLYNGATADPKPVVAVDYTVPANAYVERFNLQVWRTDGTPAKVADVIFSNPQPGSTIPLTFRIGAALDAAALGMTTGAYPVEARVYRMNNGAWDMNTAATAGARLLVVDRSASPFGAGWWPAGVERLFVAASGSAMLVTGDGSALFYAKQPNGSFATPAGEHATLTWESGPQRFKRAMPGGRISVYYDATGHVMSVQDNNGNSASYTWQNDKPTVLTDAVGKTVTFNFATAGQVDVAIPGMSSSRLTLNGSGNLSSITDPDNFVTSFSYGSGTHRMTQSAARGTAPFTYTYDDIGRIATTAGQTGSARTIRAWQRVVVAPAGTGTSSSPAPATNADTAYQRISWARGGLTDVAWFLVDRSGAPVWIVTPGVGGTRLERDSAGQVTRVIEPGGLERRQQWDTAGRVVRQIQLTWLPSGAIRPDTTLYEYHPTWQSVTSVRTALGITTTIAYDNLGRQQSVTNAAGEATQFTYTSRGQLQTIREPAPTSGQEAYPTTYVYDPVTFNLTSVSDSVPNVVQYEYDATHGSDVVAAIDAVGARTEYQYDGIKRVTRVRTAPGNARGALASNITSTTASVVLYGYDDVNRVRTQTDPNGMVSRWQHDAIGRVTSFCPRATENWCETTTYGDGLNPTDLVNKKGEHVVQSFDGAGRVVERKLGLMGEDDVIRFSYDPRGNPTTVTNKYATIYRGYDAAGNLTWEGEAIKNWGSSDMREVGAHHFYDADNRRVKTYLGNTVHLTKGTPCQPIPEDQIDNGQPCGVMLPASTDSIAYAYDGAGRLTSITNTLWKDRTTTSGSKKWEYSYDRKGRVIGLTVPVAGLDPNNVSYQYDAEDRLVHSSFYQRVYDLTHDELGRILQLGLGPSMPTEDFTYDGMARLRFHSGSSMATESFDYDSTGNRTYSGNANFRAETWSYQYNTRGQLVVQTPAAPNPAGDRQRQFAYDGNGAQVLDSAVGQVPYGKLQYRKLFYNKGGQLDSTITAVVPENTGPIPPSGPDIEKRTFWYDGLGRRIFTLSNNLHAKDRGAWKYWWLGDQVVVKTRNIADTSVAYTTSSGSTRYVDLLLPFIQRDSAGNLVGEGEWFYNGPGVDNVLGSWHPRRGAGNGTARRLFYKDYRGSVTYIATDNGRTMAMSTTNYSAYGAPSSGSGEAVTNPGFNGQEQAGGLVYMRNRWYDPNTGRFTQQDPIGYGGGINLYAYAGNDPVTFSDPFGLAAQANDTTVEVGCRRLADEGGAVGNHCAIRVTMGDSSRVGELLKVDGKNQIIWWGPGTAPDASKYNWVKVDASPGRVTETFDRIARTLQGRDYHWSGNSNSNRFVFDVITGAGGKVPTAVIPTHGATPGICGGSPLVALGGWIGGAATGNQCSP